MVHRGYFSHTTPAGSELADRLRGYREPAPWWWIGEVLAWGAGERSRPIDVLWRWLASPSHRRILLAPGARDIGIGIALGAPVATASQGSATFVIQLGWRRRSDRPAARAIEGGSFRVLPRQAFGLIRDGAARPAPTPSARRTGSPVLRPLDQARRSPDPVERLMVHAVECVTAFVPAAAAAFSPVDRRLHAFTIGPVVVRLTTDRLRLQAGEAHEAYLRAFHRLDPFAPWRWADNPATVVGTRDLGGRERFAASRYATIFLGAYGLADQACLYLRDRGRIVALIALLREAGGPEFGGPELAALRRTQPLLEHAYTLARGNDPHGGHAPGAPLAALGAYGLTPREIDVAQLAATGATNAEIARALFMSVGTVKTHMTHVLAKLGVRSRTELVLLLTDRPAAPHPARTPSSRRARAAVR